MRIGIERSAVSGRRPGAGWPALWLACAWYVANPAFAGNPVTTETGPPPRSGAPSGSLLIVAPEPGAQVWVNGRFSGTAPVRVDSLPAGTAEVKVGRAPGDSTWSPPRILHVNVRAGSVDSVRVPAATTEGGVESIPGTLPESHRAVDWKTRAELALPAAAVILGVAGVWSRQTADRAYREYQHTIDPAVMQSRLDRTRTLDRTASACWISAEVCLASAAWIWLKHDEEDPPLAILRREDAWCVTVNLLGAAREVSR